MESSSSSRRATSVRILLACCLAIVLPILLTHMYKIVARIQHGNWQAAAVVNTALALVVIAARVPLARIFRMPRDGVMPTLLRRILQRRRFLPAICVLAGSTAIASMSRFLQPGSTTASLEAQQWYFIFLIPIIEEYVFRGGVSPLLRWLAGPFWGAYLSACAFALVHSWPSWDKMFHGQLTVPLGPLFLGICCEFLFIASGRISATIALHAACNATVVVFALIDARWLHWLGILYS